MTKQELGIKLMEYNKENVKCEICEEILTYVIVIQGRLRSNIKQVGLCKGCFFLGERND